MSGQLFNGVSNVAVMKAGCFAGADALRAQTVVPVLASCTLPILGLYALYPPAKHLARKSRVVIDFLVDALSGQPAWELGW